jgi:hypothetical protein
MPRYCLTDGKWRLNNHKALICRVVWLRARTPGAITQSVKTTGPTAVMLPCRA